ncbi:Segregation and condensation protein B [Botrimarina colliarenosi]|uniref:Segregation and condensation protein B n=1 Tax=Botrimarina colliarenosi TaxID=2528001 RepID=A0A5C6AK59_9BACT|nr:SMC-Scp complex subunit ScpB [Botrimarina colliarenosi]TWT99887.1 Segregation and condensation protein B [Botrimarina colliarenosi]
MNEQDANDEGPVTLPMSRLRAAFERMLDKPSNASPAPDPDAVTPEGIVEAVLFVGRSDDAPISAEAIAAVIRDVSAADVDTLIERLDQHYDEDHAACRVERSPAGYRLVLAEAFADAPDRLGGRVRASRLSPAALECLSVIAYRQPIAVAAIDALRGGASGPTLRQLVRRDLVRCDEPSEGDEGPRYATTDRFLQLLGLSSLQQLPRVEELDD